MAVQICGGFADRPDLQIPDDLGQQRYASGGCMLAPEACGKKFAALSRQYYDNRFRYSEDQNMADATTMTTKGQVTVPREIRDRLGLKSGDKMAFTMLSDGTVVMRPKTRRLADLAGSLTRPGQPKVAVEDMSPFKATVVTMSTTRQAQ